MNPADDSQFETLAEDQMLLVNRLCNQFEAAWQRGERPRAEQAVVDLNTRDRLAVLMELLPIEIEYRSQCGENPVLHEYQQRFPEMPAESLLRMFQSTHVVDQQISSASSLTGGMPDEPLAIPEKLGDYRIVSRIGSGGMGTVYKAIHERMDRTVALKVLNQRYQRDPVLLRRFEREVRTAARLSHPNIVAALDAREDAGIYFLITEYVDGRDLQAQVIQDGPLTVAAAIDCIKQAARGLEYAHGQGIIHRDIKPANLLRDQQGTVKILDMGLARIDTFSEPAASSLTQSGMVLGTAAYMSPEQARNTRRADARSDLYSLGCTLFYLLHARNLYQGETVIDTLMSHAGQPVPRLLNGLGQAPATLERIFQKLVAKNPDDRYQTAGELIRELELCQNGEFGSDLPTKKGADTTQVEGGRQSPLNLSDKTIPNHLANQLNPPSFHQQQTAKKRYVIATGVAIVICAMGLFFAMNQFSSGKRPSSLETPGIQAGAIPSVGLRFNGRSSYVAVPDLIPKPGAPYTLEIIAKPSQFRTSNLISWFGPDWIALFLMSDGSWGIGRRVQGVPKIVHTSQPAVLNETVHLVAECWDQSLRLYVNGQLVPLQDFSYDLRETRGGLHVGGFPNNILPDGESDRFFDGEIHAVRISNGIRYSQPFPPAETLDLDSNTLALFQFHEGQGNIALGSGERNWEGRIVDAVWIPSQPSE